MAHYAKVVNGFVEDVIVADEELIRSRPAYLGIEWIQTSYNTVHGEHLLGGVPLRKNYATVGGTYDKDRDAFISVKPHASWILDEVTCTWIPPTPFPNDGNSYMWNEESCVWEQVSEPE